MSMIKRCDICGVEVVEEYRFWNRIITGDSSYTCFTPNNYDVCNKCFNKYIIPAIVEAHRKENERNG